MPLLVSEKRLLFFRLTNGGNAVVDAVLRIVAHKQNADILVLDSLELAAGPVGALGKDGSLVDEIYSRLPIERFTAVEDIQRFFIALPSAGLESPSPPRRIIYMRDFGSIARAPPPIMIFIFRAIENLRTAHKSSMIVVFGSSRPLGRFAHPDSDAVVQGFYTFKWNFENSSISSDARTTLKTSDNPSRLVPILKNKIFYSDMPFKRRTLASAFFTPIFLRKRAMSKDLLSFAKKAQSTDSDSDKSADTNSNSDTPTTTNDDSVTQQNNGDPMCVYPEEMRIIDQQSGLDDRASQLSGVILKLILAQKGIRGEGPCTVSKNLLDREREDNELKYSTIDPTTVNCISETLLMVIGQTAGPLSIATGDQVMEVLRIWLEPP
ncbi:hypothetical protein L218DRAFT_555630 [Marasmius fiardii PR-910]|nr:hypothetical protein L218DRAFT_555630 [Marasmius fiardii PR-910]